MCHSAVLTRRGTLGRMRRARAAGLVSMVMELLDEDQGKGRETVSIICTCKIEASWWLNEAVLGASLDKASWTKDF